MPVLYRRAILPTTVLFLAAGYAMRALVGVVQGEPDVRPDPWADVEQAPAGPVLVPVRDVAGPASKRDPRARKAPARAIVMG
jgi:hypothetical protein